MKWSLQTSKLDYKFAECFLYMNMKRCQSPNQRSDVFPLLKTTSRISSLSYFGKNSIWEHKNLQPIEMLSTGHEILSSRVVLRQFKGSQVFGYKQGKEIWPDALQIAKLVFLQCRIFLSVSELPPLSQSPRQELYQTLTISLISSSLFYQCSDCVCSELKLLSNSQISKESHEKVMNGEKIVSKTKFNILPKIRRSCLFTLWFAMYFKMERSVNARFGQPSCHEIPKAWPHFWFYPVCL